MTIEKQTNGTECFPIYQILDTCHQFYQHGSLPNMLGHENIQNVLHLYDKVQSYQLIFNFDCYQHWTELICHVMVPQCNPVTKQVIYPCKKTCLDLRAACSKITLPNVYDFGNKSFIRHHGDKVTIDTSGFEFNCEYLPSLGGDIPCFYKPVTCIAPPSIENGVSNMSHLQTIYSLHDTMEYTCNEGFQMKGQKMVQCEYSGNWSAPPVCSAVTISPLMIVLPILMLPLCFPTVGSVCRAQGSCQQEKIQGDGSQASGSGHISNRD